MTRQDYARLDEIAALLVAENPPTGAALSALLVEKAALHDLIGRAVVVATQAQYDALHAKIPEVTQEELDGMRNYENARAVAAPAVVVQAPGTVQAGRDAIVSRAHARDLFTFEEKAAIYASQDGGVKAFLGDLAARDTINLQHPKFAAALAYLVAHGLLTEPRAAAIVANESVDN